MSQSIISHGQAPAAIDTHAAEKWRSELKEKAGRFRILVIGRANAGKTTILKKICNTTEDPEIYASDGRQVGGLAHRVRTQITKFALAMLQIKASDLEPSDQRGLHNIENEMVFRSSPTYVFHDSRGFEAGGVDELTKVNNFISARSEAKKLCDQIHIIWYCIPMDDDRPIANVENQFFSRVGTGKVPVIAVFTKCEALEVKALTALEDQGYSYEEAIKKAPEYVQKNLKNTHEDLQKMKYPPNCHVYLQELNKPDKQCMDLVESTIAVVDSDILEAVFISAQGNNLDLAMKYSLRWGLKEGWDDKPEEIDHDILFRRMLSYFPYYVSNNQGKKDS